METLGTYELTGHLTSQNSGYSVWGFGKKHGKDYFIKQFLSPKYPANDTVSSPASLAKKKKKCELFEQRKVAIYNQINRNSDGNAVRVEEFFRIDTKYYISMRKIEALPWTVDIIASFPDQTKRYLCAVIAHGIASLHAGHVVHADLKHDNILFMQTSPGCITAKIIDFDSGFLETDPPADGEEIIGDQVYFSPEACKTFLGLPTSLTCKMDVFALGILFHQYFTGQLPTYDTELGTCAGEAVAKGGMVTVSATLPEETRNLLISMLDPDPAKRPTAIEVYAVLTGRTAKKAAEDAEVAKSASAAASPKAPEAPEPDPSESVSHTPNQKSGGNPFFRPGDL